MKFEKVVFIDDENQDFGTGPMAGVDQFKSEGFRLMSNRDFQKAAYYFKRSLSYNKDSVTTLVHKSYCNLKLGNHIRALKDAEEALRKQPKNVSALLQKADTYYFMGKLEEALVYFYKAKHLAPNSTRSELWVYICESAILKSIGDTKLLLTTEGDMTFLEKQVEKNRVRSEASSQLNMKSKLGMSTMNPLEDVSDRSIKNATKDKRVIRIMGDLYEDRKYMQMIFEEADRNTPIGLQLVQCTYTMVQFIDKQTVQLLNEMAPLSHKTVKKKIPSITQERARINQTISHAIALIDIEQQERNYSGSLTRAQDLLENVLQLPKGVVKKLEEVIATIYGYIGNAYLQMKDLPNALIFFRKEKDLALRHKLENTYLHSMYCIGVVYVLMGEFRKAINAWSVRLSFATTPEERCWLLHELGRSYYSICEFQRALDLGEKAMEESKKFTDEMWRLNCLILLAQAKTRLSQFASALEDFIYALEIACSMDDEPLIKAIEMSIEDIERIFGAEKGREAIKTQEDFMINIGVQTARLDDEETLTEIEKLEMDFKKDLEEECAKEVRKASRRSMFSRPSYAPRPLRYAYVTLATNDVYAIAALVLGETLIQSKTPYDKVVLITRDVTEPLRELLEATYNSVIIVDAIRSNDPENLTLLRREELGVTFTKINAWRLVNYDKGVFLDADTLVLYNIDDLFQREPFSAAPDAGWPDCFNSGVFVYQPSLEMFDRILEFALKYGSFDGGDQGLLNEYFSDWKEGDIKHHLPFTYNMAWQAYYSYKPALKQYGAEVKVIHYIGVPKPWEHGWNPLMQMIICNPMETIQNFELLQLWWDIFMSSVQQKLPRDYDGIVGRLANLEVRTLASQTDSYSTDRQRQYKWERNEIDYLGKDRFENIQKKLDLMTAPDQRFRGVRGYQCLKIESLKRMKAGLRKSPRDTNDESSRIRAFSERL